jgi:hypothetical protein
MVVFSIPAQNRAIAPADLRDLAEIQVASSGFCVAAAVRRAIVRSWDTIVFQCVVSQ